MTRNIANEDPVPRGSVTVGQAYAPLLRGNNA